MVFLNGKLEIAIGDITQCEVDAIVNAAHSSLLGGGGVDGAIHRAAGPLVYEECRLLNGCATGDAKITTGGMLPARYIIHTVGPIYKDGQRGEDEKLDSCYRRCFQLMVEHQLQTIAFPAISTGAYGFPLERATRIALRATQRFLAGNPPLDKILFICFDERTFTSYLKAAAEVFP